MTSPNKGAYEYTNSQTALSRQNITLNLNSFLQQNTTFTHLLPAVADFYLWTSQTSSK